MAYTTTLKFAQKSGLGLRILDENVGTGTGTEEAFDLDHINIITGSYTLQHSALTTPNTMTALVETTHYTLDKESGRIVLNVAGLAALGTDVLYATYYYTDGFSDSVISDLITDADDEIDKWTGIKWDTPTNTVEYQNGKSRSRYPTTNNPYTYDVGYNDYINLKKAPVTSVNNVYFLSRPLTVSASFNYDDSGSAYTNIIDNVNSMTVAPVDIFSATPTANDIIYIGASNRFLGLSVSLSTVGVDAGTTAIDWEYWNGTAWTDLTETDIDSGASIFTVSGTFNWSFPYGWETTTVNGSQSLYYIRGKLTTDGYSTDPVLGTLKINDAINMPLEPRQFQIEGRRKLNFMDVQIIDGTRNIRIDYTYGTSTTPTYIAELSMLITAVSAYVNLSGGSYDAATSYTLGSKSVTIGEQYVNIREVIVQFNKRIAEIYKMIGKRNDVVAI